MLQAAPQKILLCDLDLPVLALDVYLNPLDLWDPSGLLDVWALAFSLVMVLYISLYAVTQKKVKMNDLQMNVAIHKTVCGFHVQVYL